MPVRNVVGAGHTAGVPWCDQCDAFVAESDVVGERDCPTCGRKVDTSDRGAPRTAKAPWHFWLLVIGVVLYLGWRLIEGIVWVVQRF